LGVSESDETRDLKRAAPAGPEGLEREVGLANVLSSVLRVDTTVRIGPYVVQGQLGAGGMGTVYRAWDPRLERTVALKLLREADEGGERLQHEARALAKLKHPNVVAVHDVGTDDRGGYVAMELIDGPTLRTWVETHPDASAVDVVRMFGQAGRGLAAAHAVGVVHRDFKPDNAIVGSDGRVRVVDFGIARVGDREDDLATAGTPNFMAPEQQRGDEVDARTDQYSFCVALQRALDLPETPARSGELPRECRAALERGLSEQPGERWPSMDALLEALDPKPRTRRWWAVTAVAAATAVGGVAYLSRSRAPQCPAPGVDAATAWHESERSALERRFADAETPGASTVLRRMDAFVDAWTDARSAACGLLHAADDTLAAQGSQRLECLDVVADGFGSFAEDLVARDDDALHRAGMALDALHRPRECEAPQETLVGSAPDRNLLLEIQAGRVARSLYDHDTAVARLTPAYEQATEAGFHRLAASAALMLAMHDNDEDAVRREWSERALASAERAQNIDLMVRAWVRLSYLEVSAIPTGPWEDALSHAARLAAAGSVQPLTSASLAEAQANGAARTGKHLQALEHYDTAIAAYGEHGAKATVGAVHCDKAQAHSALGDMTQALDALDTCLTLLEDDLGKDHPSLLVRLAIGMKLTMIANDLERTIALGDHAIRVGKRGKHRSRFRIAPYLYAAGANTELGRYPRALELLDEGLTVAKALQSTDGEASIHAQFGATLSESGDCQSALPHLDAALDLRKYQAESELIRGITYLNRGECHAKLGHSDAAMADVERAWAVIDLPETSTLRLSQVRLDAKISMYAGHLDRAASKLAYVEERAEALDLAPADLGYAFYLRARVEAERGDHALAQTYVERAAKTYEGHTESAGTRFREFDTWAKDYAKTRAELTSAPP